MPSDHDDVLRKVRALLAQAEHPNTPPEEAKTFSAAAQRLIAKYAIEEALLRGDTTSGRGEPGITPVKIKNGNLQEGSCQLLWMLSRFSRCRAIQVHSYGDFVTMEIVGFEHDREMCYLLYQSLGMQALHEMLATPGMKATKGYTTSFFLGYIEVIRIRFRESTRQAERDVMAESGRTSESMALALVSDEQKIEEWIANHYGRLGHARSSNRQLNSAAYGAGQAAGRRADLGGGKVGGGGRKEIG